ncbi:prolyl oligopeptidase family serine peptidase [Melioribacter sp. OK-6-Me]|uniref:prolyl oligopeptidase family serine peptidase n=1 Tax=unclassified Melioribacter TaxID=2627329 RepID=UPI003F5CF865
MSLRGRIAYSIVIIILTMTLACFAQDYSKCWKDVDYVGDSLIYHRLDIYLPKVIKDKYPVAVVIYGSAWFGNNLKGMDLPILGKPLLEAGFAVVMPNHRSSSDAKFPAQLHDIKAVVRFIRGNASQYQLDTSFIGITGSSSGGNLAAMLGTSRFVKQYTLGNETIDVEGNLGSYLTYSSSVDAVVDWFGPTNMLVMDSCGGTDFIHNDAKSPASLYIGGPLQEHKEKTLLASPITYVDSADPAFLIFHGDNDRVVPYCQSVLLHEALQKAGVSSRLFLVKGGQHGFGMYTEENIKLMIDFFINELEKKEKAK